MTEAKEEVKRGRGRPKGSSDKRKIKLKPNPKSAKEDFAKKYEGLDLVAVYGYDEFTFELITHLWKNPSIEFVFTDPIPSRGAHMTRHIGNLSWSIHRYEVMTHVGFIEEGYFPVVVVSDDCWEEVSKLPNPHEVELVSLSHWEKS
jgi:hypothetical protein